MSSKGGTTIVWLLFCFASLITANRLALIVSLNPAGVRSVGACLSTFKVG